MLKCVIATAFFLLSMSFVLGAEAPETSETLTRDLTVALQQTDWQKITLAAKAFRGAELKDSELELAVVRAERDAALELTQPGNGGMVKPLGQAARFLAGNHAAIEVLHKWAYTPIPDAPPADPSLWADRPQEAIEIQKAQLQALTEREQQQYAFVTLAYLKDPDLPAKALAALKDFKGDGTGLGAFHIIEALLVANAEDGLRQVLELCADRDVPVTAQAELLSALMALSDPNVLNNGGMYNLTVANEFREKLPKDLRARVMKLYVSFLQRCTPDTLNENTLFTLVNIVSQFAPQSLDSNVVAALKGARARTQNSNLRQQIGWILKQQRPRPKDF